MRKKDSRKTQKIVLPWSILTKISKRVTAKYMYLESESTISKFWLRGGQRLKLRHNLDGFPLHDATVN